MFRIVNDDVINGLHDMPDNSFDGVLCDPPYELGFMGKSWDSTGIAFQQETWAEVLRVCKPGAHLLAFGGSRTFHRLVCAVEDAGWEVRDCLQWLYGSGFPKSMDVSKAIDKAAGAEREVVGHSKNGIAGGTGKHAGVDSAYGFAGEFDITAPATDAARLWNGYGTALKPAYEPVVLARKPLDGTVAQNVQKWGCGALWIDGGRVGMSAEDAAYIGERIGGFNATKSIGGNGAFGGGKTMDRAAAYDATKGRWPANALHDGLPEEWARYFYCAKASQKERNAGCEGVMTWENAVPDQEIQSALSLARDIYELITQNQNGKGCFMMWFGNNITEQYQQGLMFTISTVSRLITELKTSNFSQSSNTSASILAATRTLMGNGSSPAKNAENIRTLILNTTKGETELVLGAVAALLQTLLKISESAKRGNIHSTVKPLDLCRYLATLILPPADRPQGPRKLLVPFSGSGSEMIGSLLAGWDEVTGVEREAEYVAIAKARISHYMKNLQARLI